MNIQLPFAQVYTKANDLFAGISEGFVLFALRCGLAGIFWSSGRTKVDGMLHITDSTYFLFEEEYNLPLIAPEIAAHMATYAEHLLPILLVFGLATRFAAFGLFVMTMTIQIFVYPDALLATHLGWFALALAVMKFGPGCGSLDHLISTRFRG